MTGDSGPASWIDEVSTEKLIEYNAGIAQWVRLSGSEDERAAFDLIESWMRELGLQTTLHEPTCLVSWPLEGQLEVNGESFPCITHSFSRETGPEGVAGQLVDGGAGTDLELAGAGARGAIALTQGLATPQKAAAATAVGARALVCVSGEQIHEMIVSPVWGSPTLETLPLLPQAPIVSIDNRAGGRIREMIESGPVRARVVSHVDTRWRKIPVLVADLDVDERDYVLFSGHVDSWHFGAMDNASANATMIEVARILANHRSELRRGLRLAFWSGHSHARYAGSTWFADAYWHELRDRCVAHINVDSTGGIGATDLTSANSMADTYELAKEIIRRQTGQELHYQRFGRAGDQSFWGVGLPALFMSLSHQGQESAETSDQVRLVGGTSARGGGLGWWWHTTEDTMDKIDPDNLTRDTRIYVEVVGRMMVEPVVPLDVRGPVAEMLAELDDIEAQWNLAPMASDDDALGLGDLRLELERLRDLAERAMSRAADIDEAGAEANVLSGAIVEACKLLLPANYTIRGEFEHDLALGTQTLPALRPPKPLVAMSDDEQWAATHGVRRAINRVRAAVRAATGELAGVAG